MQIEITEAYDVLTLMPSTDSQVEKFSSQIKSQLLNQEVDWRQLLFQKKFIEKTLDAIFGDKEVKSFVETEIEKYGKDGCGYNDLKFEVQSRKTWDYSQTGDSIISDLEAEKKVLDEKIKARQKFLQNIPESGIADTETGEIVYKAAFTSSSFIKSSTVK